MLGWSLASMWKHKMFSQKNRDIFLPETRHAVQTRPVCIIFQSDSKSVIPSDTSQMGI